MNLIKYKLKLNNMRGFFKKKKNKLLSGKRFFMAKHVGPSSSVGKQDIKKSYAVFLKLVLQ